MKKLIFLVLVGFGVYLLWNNVKTEQEDGQVNFSVNKDGVEQKLQSAGNKISGAAKSAEEKFNK